MFHLFILSLSVIITSTIGECISGCNEPTLLYETLKCAPVYASPGDCCPKQFDCSHFETRNDGQCYFNGKAYGIGKHISDDEIYGNCFIDCTCFEKRSGGKAFGCTALDCAEWLRLKPREGCHFKHEINKCCSTGELCPPFDVKCEVNGTIYKEGEQFSVPNSKCTKCVCGKGFQGKYEAPFCRKMECLSEIRNALAVKNFCAPTYMSTDDCCPRQWICPGNDNIEVVKGSTKSNDPKCKFGDRRLNIGEKFERVHLRSGGRVSCECRIPPYLTCIQDKKYPVFAGDYH